MSSVAPSLPALLPSANARLVGLAHWLDQDQTVIPWAKRVPALAYPLAAGLTVAKELSHSKPEQRKKTLAKTLVQLSLPTAATLWATHKWMQPEMNAMALGKSAEAFISKTYPDLLHWADTMALEQLKKPPKALQRLYWGDTPIVQALSQPVSERLRTAPHTVLDVESKVLINGLQSRFKQSLEHLNPEQLPEALHQRWQSLTHSAEHMVLEQAATHEAPPPKAVLQQGYSALLNWTEQEGKSFPLLHWPQYLQRKGQQWVQQKGYVHPAWLLKQELRLLLPIDDDFSIPKHLFNSSVGTALSHAAKETVHDIQQEAGPFFKTGGLSILSGIGSGLLSNHLFNAPRSNDADVVKEGVFQFVANVCMCALGAAAGMGTANALGFSKFEAPLLRFLSISSGLGAGIIAGSTTANHLSEKVVGPVVQNLLGPKAQSEKGRALTAADMSLHLDDAPMALALSGLNVLKACIPPFFYLSAIKAAQGFRNVEAPHSLKLEARSVQPSGFLHNSPVASATLLPHSFSTTSGGVFSGLSAAPVTEDGFVATLQQPALPLGFYPASSTASATVYYQNGFPVMQPPLVVNPFFKAG